MTPLKYLIAVLMAFLLMAGAAGAQVNLGTITGIVTDPTGGVVPGAAITITNTATGVTNKVTTNESGVFTVPLLPPSTYTLVAVKEKFKTFTQSDILVQVGATVRADVSLTLGSKMENVRVTGTALTLARETSDIQTTITGSEMEYLPLTSYAEQRNPAAFMQLAPGVTGKGTTEGAPGDNRTMSTQVSGSMVSSTSLILDGADIPTLEGFEGDLRALQVPPDAIGEFKLEANNANAEFGRSGGGAASFQVKSGTNQIHGSAFEFVRNDA